MGKKRGISTRKAKGQLLHDEKFDQHDRRANTTAHPQQWKRWKGQAGWVCPRCVRELCKGEVVIRVGSVEQDRFQWMHDHCPQPDRG